LAGFKPFFIKIHPEIKNFRLEPSAVGHQHKVKLFLLRMVKAEY
jgi:hypothetical protein